MNSGQSNLTGESKCSLSLKVEVLLVIKANVPLRRSVVGEVSKLMQGAYENHAALQGLKSFLQAIMDMNDISSQGNNQNVQRICDYNAVCVSRAHRYIFQIFNVKPRADARRQS